MSFSKASEDELEDVGVTVVDDVDDDLYIFSSSEDDGALANMMTRFSLLKS